MTAPNVLAPEQTTTDTNNFFTKHHDGNIPTDVLVLLRDLQTQLTAAEARITVLEGA